MTHVATYIRIFHSDPSDDLVNKRTAAIGEIAATIESQTNVGQLLGTANDLATAAQHGGSLPASLSKMIEDAIRKSSTAFVAEKHDLEMLVCGLAGALQVLTGSTPLRNGVTSVADVLSFGLWSALSFQKPRSETKLEQLRSELMQAAQNHCARAAIDSRRRVKLADPEFTEVAKKEDNAAAELDAAAVKEGLEPFRNAIADLEANAAIDREEIDLLWWVLSDWSALLGRRFSTEKGAVAAVASGFEAGRMIRRTPAEAHRHLVLRNVPEGKELSLQELLAAIGEDRSALAPTESQPYILQCPAVFPLSSALTSGSAHDVQAKVKRSIGDWADRALLESAIAHICSNVPSVSL